MTWKDDDYKYMALTIYGEARGEPLEGQAAVGFVILTRARKRKWDIRTTVLRPFQFSCWNTDDPNRKELDLLMGNWDGAVKEKCMLRQCFWVARGVLDGWIINPVPDADHYVTRRLFVSPNAPDWVARMEPVQCIGRHVFLRST